MANKTIDMNKIRKVIHFYEEGKSKLFISNYLSLSRNTVKKYISTYLVIGSNWEVLSKKTDEELEAIFITVPVPKPDERLKKLYAYFPKMERELKRVGATIQKAWEKYIAENPDGFKPTQFRTHYQKWSKKVNPVMHMEHKAGDKLFVDYAGKTLSYYDLELKETIEAQFFVAVLGASQFTYCEATRSQKKGGFY